MYYQPQYDVRTHAMRGWKRSMRWTLPNGKSVSPAQFIPVAEETGAHLFRLGRMGAARGMRLQRSNGGAPGARLTRV